MKTEWKASGFVYRTEKPHFGIEYWRYGVAAKGDRPIVTVCEWFSTIDARDKALFRDEALFRDAKP